MANLAQVLWSLHLKEVHDCAIVPSSVENLMKLAAMHYINVNIVYGGYGGGKLSSLCAL